MLEAGFWPLRTQNTQGMKSLSPAAVEEPTGALPVELNDADTEWAVWSDTALFDEVNQLEDAEQEQLRLMLESAQRGPDNK